MEIFLIICLVSGLASTEKLDRTYLPPPGSKFSGGSPGDIETPLEFPKQSTGPQIGNGRPEIKLGINPRPASTTGSPDSQKPGFNYFQKSYPVPKTTTSYAITQTTTFAPEDQYAGIDHPSAFLNGSTVQSGFPGQDQQIRKPGQGPYNEYSPGQSQSSLIGPYGTTTLRKFPGVFSGPEYLPPVSHKQSPTQVISNQDGSGYQSGLTQGPKYQGGQAVSAERPDYFPQQNQYVGNLNIPSTASPQYQGGRFVPTGPGSQKSQNQFPSSTAAPQYQDGQRFITPGFNQQNQFTGSKLPSSTAVPQYQDGQRLITPGSNQPNQFTGSQFPSSTAAPQYQGGQRLFTPGSNQQDQFASNQDLPSSTAAPQSQFGQRFTTPGLNQQVFGARLPNQQNQFTGYQYPRNQNFPSSTAAPTPGSIEQNQFTGNQNFHSTAAPNYQDGERFTTSGQTQGTQLSGQPGFGSRVPSQGQNQFAGQNFPTSTSAPQFQDGTRLTTPGYVQEGYESPVLSQQNQNQYPGNQNYPSSTTAPQYQNGQQFTTLGPIGNQNFPSTAAPVYQGGQRVKIPGQFLGQQGTESRIPGQKPTVNQNHPSSTTAPQYQNGQQFSTPEAQDRFESPQPNQHNKYHGGQYFPTSTAPLQNQDGQRFSTPGSEQTFGPPQRNQYGNQNFPSSTAAPQYQGQRITTPGQLFNQPTYPGSTTDQQYQQTFVPTPGTNQQGVIPSQQDQFQRPVSNQQFPSSTTAPQRFVPGSQPQYGSNNNIPTPGADAVFPGSQIGLPEGQTYGDIRQPISQAGVGPLSGTGATFPSTTIGSLPARDFASTPGFGTISGGGPERPQAESDRNAEILSYENELTPDSYFYSYDTSNGIHADETGTLGNGTRAQGGFSYTGDDGKLYSVVYSADENGFQPRGDHLPTPPPIPEAIQRVIDQANKDKESGIDDDGSYNDEKYGYMKYEGPFSRLKSQNKMVSLVNGADIPSDIENRVGEQTKKTSKNRGRKPVSNTGNRKVFESDYEETDANGSETEEMDVNEGNRRHDSNDKNRRISSKRPKPIQNLNLEDNRSDEFKGIKMSMKPTSNSKTGSLHTNKETERNGPRHRPTSSEGNDESVSDDITKESEDTDELKESQGFDYDSDLVNYEDDPNHRTDFHGFNKYLPESKQNNRKNELAKKRPNVRLNGKKQSIGVSEVGTPEDRNNQESEDSRPDFVDESRTRIPSRKNKISQRVKELSKVTGEPGNDDETNSYSDNRTYTDEEDGSDDARKPVTNDRVSKPGTSQLTNKTPGKLKRPNVNDRTDLSDDKRIKSLSYEDNGYEYTPPQRKFGSEVAIKFPSRVNEKVAQTTLRPFMTKNVYGDEDEPVDDYNDEYDGEKTGRDRLKIGQKQYPGYNQPPGYVSDSYNQNNPKANEDEMFSSTRRPISYGTSRPFGRPQTTGTSQYQEDIVTGQIYNEPAIQSQSPGDKFYNTNAPNRGTGANVFSSTTPLPPSEPGSSRYQRPSYQNRPTDGSNYDTTYGANTPPGQLPSTTYRPNYSFGSKNIPVIVDSSGRPIQSTNAPTFDRTLRPNYSTARPSESENRSSDVTDQFRPTEGRFGVTSTQVMPGYQSTSSPIGEDFSGPKQPQRFDSKTGYHYK